MRAKRPVRSGSSLRARVLALVLAACVCCSCLAPAALADSGGDDITPHHHTDECFLISPEKRVLTCSAAEEAEQDGRFFAHKHDSLCYDEDGNLICTLPELEEHEHTEDCYEEVLVCTESETGGAGETDTADEPEVPDEPVEPDDSQPDVPGEPPDSGAGEAGESDEASADSDGDAAADAAAAAETAADNDGSPADEDDTAPQEPDDDIEGPAPAPESGHVHTDDCWEKQLVCELHEVTERHQHTEECFTIIPAEYSDTPLCGLEEETDAPENPEDPAAPEEDPGTPGTGTPDAGNAQTPGEDGPGIEDPSDPSSGGQPSDDGHPGNPEQPPSEEDAEGGSEGEGDGAEDPGQDSAPELGPSQEDPSKEFKDDFTLTSSEETSGDLGDFLVHMVITDAEGNVITAEEMEFGVNYTLTLEFEEPADQHLLFRPATEQELRDAGIPPEDCIDGQWMYVLLDSDVTVVEGSGGSSADIKVVNDGKALLYRWHTDSSGGRMTKCSVSFTGVFEDTDGDGKLDLVVSEVGGEYEPPHITDRTVKKTSKYNPETRCIEYTITVHNPGDDPLNGFIIDDQVSAAGYESSSDLYRVLGDSFKINGQPVSAGDVELSDHDTHFKLASDEVVEAGGKLEITYEVDVGDLADTVNGAAGSFDVSNSVSVNPAEGQTEPDADQFPLTDENTCTVYLGELTKNGYKNNNWWGWSTVIRWNIHAYDPYEPLDEALFSEYLPEQFTIDDIVGVLFCDEAGNLLKSYVNPQDQDWDRLAQLKNLGFLKQGTSEHEVLLDMSCLKDFADFSSLFTDGTHHRLYIALMTKYPEGPDGFGYYENTVKTTLPGESEERSAEASIFVGTAGVHTEKTASLADNRKDLNYTITVNVDPQISSEHHSWYGSVAAVADLMNIYDGGTSVYIDAVNAAAVTSVVAKYTEGGQDHEWTFSDTDDAQPGHRYGLYSVVREGTYDTAGGVLNSTGYLRIVKDTEESGYLAFVFNPTEEKQTYGGREMDTVHGDWPDDLDRNKVTLTISYTIDPSKATFVNAAGEPVQCSGCSTLQEYSDLMGDIIVYNTATATVKDATDSYTANLNLVRPLIKEAEKKVDPLASTRTAEYTVTFQNGLHNNSSIDRTKAENLVFKDSFDTRMEYIPDTLSVKLVNSDGTEEAFVYRGQNPVAEGTSVISAKWLDFHSVQDAGRTLESDFKAQIGHYKYVFTYSLRAKAGDETIPEDEAYMNVENEAWVEYNGGSLEHVVRELEFPTGAFTKTAVLENGNVSFYVEINEQEAKLSPGGDTLTVKDKPSQESSYLQLVTDSIVVEEYDHDTGGWKDITGTDAVQKVVDPETGEFSITVPDQKRLRIHYTYVLTEEGAGQGNVTITNSATVEGVAGLKDDGSWTFSTSQLDSSASGTTVSFKMKKLQEGTNTPVSGVEFILYAPNAGGTNTAAAEAAAAKAGVPKVEYEGSLPLKPVYVYTSDEQGDITVDWEILRPGVIYALVESDAPKGYQKLDVPVVIRLDESGNVTILNEDQTKLSTLDELLTVLNPYVQPQTVSIELAVTKMIEGIEETAEKFTFELKELVEDAVAAGIAADVVSGDGRDLEAECVAETKLRDSGISSGTVPGEPEIGAGAEAAVSEGIGAADGTPVDVFADVVQAALAGLESQLAAETAGAVDGPEYRSLGTVEITGAGTARFPALTYETPGVHHYTITEVQGQAENWIYDQTVWNVTVTVEEGGGGFLTASAVYQRADEDGGNGSGQVSGEDPEPAPEQAPDTSENPGGGPLESAMFTNVYSRTVLPKTGGDGIGAFFAAGLPMAAAGMAVMAGRKKKHKNDR